MPLQIYGFAWIGRGCWQVTLMEKRDGKMTPIEEVKLFRRMQEARDFCAAENQKIADARLASGEFRMPAFGHDWR